MEKFRELSFEERSDTNGGILGIIITAAIAHIVTELVFNPEAHKEAFIEGYNSTAKRPL
jgi:hypothetical protein